MPREQLRGESCKDFSKESRNSTLSPALKILIPVFIVTLIAYLVAGFLIVRDVFNVSCTNVLSCVKELFKSALILLALTLGFALILLFEGIVILAGESLSGSTCH